MRAQMRWWSLGLAVAAAALVAACAPKVTTVREHPDLAQTSRPLHRLVVLPPEVEVQRIVFDGNNERLADREGAIAQSLARELASLLQNRGYMVQRFDFEAAAAQDPELRFALEQVRKAYNQASGQLYDRATVPEAQRKSFRTTLGPIVNRLAEAGDADALVLMRCAVFEKSGGVIAKEFTTAVLFAALTGYAPMSPRKGVAAELALIDGTTGDVLWTNVQHLPETSEPQPATLLTELPAARPPPVQAATVAPPATPAGATTPAAGAQDPAAETDATPPLQAEAPPSDAAPVEAVPASADENGMMTTAAPAPPTPVTAEP